MHVVNTVARELFGGVITGVQIGAGRSRIDFRLAAFGREAIPAFEARVNEIRPGCPSGTPSSARPSSAPGPSSSGP
jgi:Ser-tRNA(Ala) deacylase AlaX